MTIAVNLMMDGQSLSGGVDRNGQLKYFISGTSDPEAARAALSGYVPTGFADVILQSYRVDEAGPDSFYGTASYIPFSGDQPSDDGTDEHGNKIGYSEGLLSMTVGGESVRATQALEHIASYVPGGATVTNYHGAINVRQDGEKIEVEGVDVEVPTVTFRLSRKYQVGSVDKDKLALIAGMAKKYNSVDTTIDARGIYGLVFEAGTLFFSDAEVGEPDTDDVITIAYIFKYSPNLGSTDYGDGANKITVSSKKGWDYQWFNYGKDKDPDSKRLTSIPIQANVDRTYKTADLNALFP
jgi:hypothetical protein